MKHSPLLRVALLAALGLGLSACDVGPAPTTGGTNEETGLTQIDLNGDGQFDYEYQDTNGNGSPDAGDSIDTNGNGVIDTSELQNYSEVRYSFLFSSAAQFVASNPTTQSVLASVSDSSSTTTDADVATNGVTGSATVTAFVSNSSASSSGQLSATRAFRSTADMLRAASTEPRVNVYWQKGNGIRSLINPSNYTLEYAEFNGDYIFEISGVADGINYVIEVYFSDAVDARPLTSIAPVPKGATSSGRVTIDEVSTVVAEAVRQSIIADLTSSDDGNVEISQEDILNRFQATTSGIEKSIANGEISEAEIAAAVQDTEALATLASAIDELPSVEENITVIKQATRMKLFTVPASPTLEQAKDIIRRVFALTNDNGTPDFIINYLAQKYFESSPKTLDQVVNGVFAGLSVDTSLLVSGDIDPAEVTDPSYALADFQAFLADIKTALDRIYALDTQELNGGLSATELAERSELKAAIGEIPPVVFGLFPPAELSTWGNLQSTTNLSVPQAIALTIYIVDKYMDERLSERYEYDQDTGKSEVISGVDFDPTALLSLWGLVLDPEEEGFDESALAGLESVDVYWLELHPNKIWNPVTQQEVSTLSAYTCVEAFAVPADFAISEVLLNYPTATGVQSFAMTPMSELYGDDSGDSCFAIDPWAYGENLREQFTERASDGREFVNWDALWETVMTDPDAPIISDFITGNYSVTVRHSDIDSNTADTVVVTESQSDDFYKRIITGLAKLNPKLTYPLQEPRWPGENASDAEIADYQARLDAYQMTVIEVAEGQTSISGVVIRWNPPLMDSATLPEGVIPVYNLDIGRDLCQKDVSTGYVECEWQPVFNTWENDTKIVTNSFKLPVDLATLEVGDAPYRANLSVSFVDQETGEYLGDGGWSSAAFRVGGMVDTSASTAIFGEVSGLNSVPADSELRVALVAERCVDDGQDWRCELNVLDDVSIDIDESDADVGTYTLTPIIDDLNVPGDTWLSIRAYFDAPSYDDQGNETPADGQLTEFVGTWTDENSVEHSYTYYEYMLWSSDWLNFSHQGGVLYADGGSCEEASNGDYQCEYWYEQVLPVDLSATEEQPILRGPSFEVDENSLPDEGPKLDFANAGGQLTLDDGMGNAVVSTEITNATTGYESLPEGLIVKTAVPRGTNGEVYVSWQFNDITYWDGSADVTEPFVPMGMHLRMLGVSADVLMADLGSIDWKQQAISGLEMNINPDEFGDLPNPIDLGEYMEDDLLYLVVVEAWDDMGNWQQSAPEFLSIGAISALQIFTLEDPRNPVDGIYGSFSVGGDIANYDPDTHANFLPVALMEECGQTPNGNWFCEQMPIAVGSVLGDSTNGYYYEFDISYEGLYFGDDLHYQVVMFEDFNANGELDQLGTDPQGHPYYEPFVWPMAQYGWINHHDGLKFAYNNCDESGCSDVWYWEALQDGSFIPAGDFDLDGWDSQAPEPPRPQLEVSLGDIAAGTDYWYAVIGGDDGFYAEVLLNQDAATGPSINWVVPADLEYSYVQIEIIEVGVEALSGQGEPNASRVAAARVSGTTSSIKLADIFAGTNADITDISNDVLSDWSNDDSYGMATVLSSYAASNSEPEHYYAAIVTPYLTIEENGTDEFGDPVVYTWNEEVGGSEPVIWTTSPGLTLPTDLPEYVVRFNPIREFPTYLWEDPWSGRAEFETNIGLSPSVSWEQPPMAVNHQHVMLFEMNPAFINAPHDDYRDGPDLFMAHVIGIHVAGLPGNVTAVNLGNTFGAVTANITQSYLENADFMQNSGLPAGTPALTGLHDDGVYYVMVNGFVNDGDNMPIRKGISKPYNFIVGDGIYPDGKYVSEVYPEPMAIALTLEGYLRLPDDVATTEQYEIVARGQSCGDMGCMMGDWLSGMVTLDATSTDGYFSGSYQISGFDSFALQGYVEVMVYDDQNSNGLYDDGEPTWMSSYSEGTLEWHPYFVAASGGVMPTWGISTWDHTMDHEVFMPVADGDVVNLGYNVGDFLDEYVSVATTLAAMEATPSYDGNGVELNVGLNPSFSWSFDTTVVDSAQQFMVMLFEMKLDTPLDIVDGDYSETFIQQQVLGAKLIGFDHLPTPGTLSELVAQGTVLGNVDDMSFPPLADFAADKLYLWMVEGFEEVFEQGNYYEYSFDAMPQFFTTGTGTDIDQSAVDHWAPVNIDFTLTGSLAISDAMGVSANFKAMLSYEDCSADCTYVDLVATLTGLTQSGSVVGGSYQVTVNSAMIEHGFKVMVWDDANMDDFVDVDEQGWMNDSWTVDSEIEWVENSDTTGGFWQLVHRSSDGSYSNTPIAASDSIDFMVVIQ